MQQGIQIAMIARRMLYPNIFISLIERLGDTFQTALARFEIAVHPDVRSFLVVLIRCHCLHFTSNLWLYDGSPQGRRECRHD